MDILTVALLIGLLIAVLASGFWIGLTLLGASLPFVSGFIADQLQISVSQALHALKAG